MGGSVSERCVQGGQTAALFSAQEYVNARIASVPGFEVKRAWENSRYITGGSIVIELYVELAYDTEPGPGPEQNPHWGSYSDTFDNANSGWPTGQQAYYANGRYEIIASNRDKHWEWAPQEFSHDFTVEVDASSPSRSDDYEYGVVWQADQEEYFFTINTDGCGFLWDSSNLMASGGEFSFLLWCPSAIRKRGATNTLKVVRKGNRVRGFVNNEEIFNESYTSGSNSLRVGLVVIDWGEGSVQAYFDNFTVTNNGE